MEVRQSPNDLVSYDFDIGEKKVIHSMCQNPTFRAFIQTQKTHYVNNHILQPLSLVQAGDIDSKFKLEEAYLKGALDAFNEFLSYTYQENTEIEVKDNG